MSALLIVDVQNDFLPGGALAVNGGDEILPVIIELMEEAPLVVATQDWHPKGHVSFASVQGPWPDHCVQETFGAELSNKIDQNKIAHFVKKGCDPLVDSYSAFFDNESIHKTDLDDYLKKHGVTRLVIVGLATDYCVYFTAMDALKLGYEVVVVKEGCRAVSDEEKALSDLKKRGAAIINGHGSSSTTLFRDIR